MISEEELNRLENCNWLTYTIDEDVRKLIAEIRRLRETIITWEKLYEFESPEDVPRLIALGRECAGLTLPQVNDLLRLGKAVEALEDDYSLIHWRDTDGKDNWAVEEIDLVPSMSKMRATPLEALMAAKKG